MKVKRENIIEKKLYALQEDAKKDIFRIGKGVVKSMFRPLQPIDFEHAYLPVSKSQGESLRTLILKNNCKNIIEFGTSFGISTIYLADGARQTGGKVVTTELIESKAKKAKQNIKDAGLSDYVEFRIGDAMETLSGNTERIDFLFLDGWKDLYLPLFQMLEPQFHNNTLIYSDNMDMAGTKLFADYLSENSDRYASQVIADGKAYLTTIR